MTEILEIINSEPDFFWGPVIAQYFFFTGISAAAFLISSLTYVFGKKEYERVAGLALIVAFTVLAAAPLNLIADLEQPGRFYTLLFRTHITSPMSWGVFLLTLYPILILGEAAFAFRARFAKLAQRASGFRKKLYTFLAFGQVKVTDETETRDHKWSKRLGIIGIPMALAVHGYTGFILWFAAGRPMWNTPLMPIIFLVSAVVSGLALMILLTWLMVRDENGRIPWQIIDNLAIMLGVSIILDLLLRVLWHGLGYMADPNTYDAVITFLFAENFFESVILELGLALLLPLVVSLAPRLRRIRPLLLLTAGFAVIGVFLFRWSTVMGGQEIHKYVAGFAEYQPTTEEIMLVVANWGLWLFLMVLFTSIIPWDGATEETAVPAPTSASLGGAS